MTNSCYSFSTAMLLFALSGHSLFAQFITHGPVVGAVTPGSARMYLRTSVASPVTVELSADSLFGAIVTFTDSTRAWRDSSAVIALSGLQPFTEYYYRIVVNGNEDSLKGHFRTAPVAGKRNHYTFIVGSCSEYPEITKPWDAVIANRPHLFFHNGDFSYPDYQLPGDYRSNMTRIAESYRYRYGYPGVRKSLRHYAFDYVFDNHDGAGGRDNISTTGFTIDSAGNVHNYINYFPIPPTYLQNVFNGYNLYFPHYPLADSTEGVYHSYRYGNVEVFFLDVRSCGTQADSCFDYDAPGDLWSFNPDKPGHTMLGNKQMQWLLDGLSNSTADWKLIVSGVMFNQAFRKFINLGIGLQKLQMDIGGYSQTGFKLAHAFAYNWAGFPRESNQLMNHLKNNHIKDVVMLTGHVHTNVMDDGTNAGLPELNTGPFAGSGAELTYYIDSVMTALGQGKAIDSLWNGGGQGVNNKNFKSGFGRVDVYGNDSIVMKLIDEDNMTVSSMMIPHSSKVSSIDEAEKIPGCVVENVYPSLVDDYLNVRLCDEYRLTGEEHYYLSDISGKTYYPKPITNGNEMRFLLSDFPEGVYLWVMDYGYDLVIEKVVIER